MKMKIIKNVLQNIILYSLLIFGVFSCHNKAEKESELAPIKYLALGDSYTIGQGIALAESWPMQLGGKLIENSFSVDKNDIIAQTGWETTDLLNALADSSLEDYNLVSLLIGVNNQFSNRPFETYTSEFDLLLDQATGLAGSDRVFVVSIPDYGVTPFGSNNSENIAFELDEYNAYAAAKCQALNIPFINITEISRQLGDSNGALASDNLHPSGTQYSKWVEEMLPIVLNLLEE
jgi:lysophospholipase L1-like esterase